MNFRLPSLVAAVTLGVGLLAAPTPAEAAAPNIRVTSNHLAVTNAGNGLVWVRCGAKACKGKVGVPGSEFASKFNLKARTGGWYRVQVKPSQPGFPTIKPGQTRAQARGSVTVRIWSGKARINRTVPTRLRIYSQTIRGNISAGVNVTSKVSNPKVQLWRMRRDGSGVYLRSASVAANGNYSLGTVPLGKNNKPATHRYKLKMVGTDPGSNREVSWWWRGTSGSPDGGGRQWREGSTVRPGAGGPFIADATYGMMTGTIARTGDGQAGVHVAIAGIPTVRPTNNLQRRELDVAWCANIFQNVKTNSAGVYRATFLPMAPRADRRYLVFADPSKISGSLGNTLPLWNNEYGSCHEASRYRIGDNANAINLRAGGGKGTQNVTLRWSSNTFKFTVRYPKFSVSSTNRNDSYVRVRQLIPGQPASAMPVVREFKLPGTGKVLRGEVSNLPRGKYRIEIGRRTGCHQWMNSRYKDNNGYFNGLDRSFERKWAKNYRMYRGHCRAIGAGKVLSARFASNTTGTVNLSTRIAKGATVKGKITNEKIKPRTELMVRLVPRKSKLVYRTALTDGSGNYSVSGLAAGCYKIVVNADSWRGISRKTTGTKSICVKGSGTYSAGTKRFIQ